MLNRDVQQLASTLDDVDRLDVGWPLTDGLFYVKRLESLRWLYVRNTRVIGSSFKHLPVSLETLCLDGSPITDDSLAGLHHLRNLDNLMLRDTRTSRDAVKDLERKLRKCEVQRYKRQ